MNREEIIESTVLIVLSILNGFLIIKVALFLLELNFKLIPYMISLIAVLTASAMIIMYIKEKIVNLLLKK